MYISREVTSQMPGCVFGEATQEILGKKALTDLEKELGKYVKPYKDMIIKLERKEEFTVTDDVKHNAIMLKNLKDLLAEKYVYASFKQYQEFIIKNKQSGQFNIDDSLYDKIKDTVYMYKDLGGEISGAATEGKGDVN